MSLLPLFAIFARTLNELWVFVSCFVSGIYFAQPLVSLIARKPNLTNNKKTILIVDDHCELLELLETALKYHGYEVVVANNGLEAVRTAVMLLPDLILMDMLMPQMDGLEATSQLRSEPKTQSIPILAITANATVRDRQRFLAAGCDECIAKPYSLAELIVVIQAMFAQPQAAGGMLTARDRNWRELN